MRCIPKGASVVIKPTRPGQAASWYYLGASGVLQPLSGEFLYRSPEEPLRVTCRRVRTSRENAHVAC